VRNRKKREREREEGDRTKCQSGRKTRGLT
jgi:hypothetical protein